jgi:hypothetical protein
MLKLPSRQPFDTLLSDTTVNSLHTACICKCFFLYILIHLFYKKVHSGVFVFKMDNARIENKEKVHEKKLAKKKKK